MERNIDEKVRMIKQKIYHKPDLVISRVPLNTITRFKEIASEEEFCQDFGMALKFLVDFYDGLIPSGIEHLEQDISSLDERLSKLEETPKEEGFIQMANGKKIKKK